MFDRMPPVHPGEILSEDFLKPMALSPDSACPGHGNAAESCTGDCCGTSRHHC